ncbi:MAG: hypothetical protein V3W41_07165 [Planctomycetota bacterium]
MSQKSFSVGLSTANDAREDGSIVKALEGIFDLGVGRVELAAPRGALDIPAAAETLRRARGRIVAVRAPLIGYTASSDNPKILSLNYVTAADAEERDRASRDWNETLKWASGFRADLVLLSGGVCASVAAKEFETAAEAGADESERGPKLRALMAAREAERESAAERLCRFLHQALSEHRGLRLGLLLEGGAEALLGTEELAWVLAEFDSERVGLWYDPSAAHRRHLLGFDQAKSLWKLASERALGTYLCDSHELMTGLPLGAGTFSGLQDLLGLSPALPKILRLAPGSSRLSFVSSLEMTL